MSPESLPQAFLFLPLIPKRSLRIFRAWEAVLPTLQSPLPAAQRLRVSVSCKTPTARLSDTVTLVMVNCASGNQMECEQGRGPSSGHLLVGGRGLEEM